MNLSYFIILCCFQGHISSFVTYLYLSLFPDDNADISATSLLMLNLNCASIIFHQLP